MQLFPALGHSSPAAVTIPLDSYAFSLQHPLASFPLGSKPASFGEVTFDELQVTTPNSSQSPALLAALTSGQSYSSGVLTQRDTAGKTVAVWALGTIYVTSDEIGGDAPNGLPEETVRLAFGAITEKTSAGTASWNQVTHNTSGVPKPPDGTLTVLLGGTAPITLQLRPAAGAQPSPLLTIPLGSYDFGFERKKTNTGAKTEFDELQVTAPYLSQSPTLLAALTSGQSYSSGVLTQRDIGGKTLAVWALGTIYVTSDEIGGKAGRLPEETLKLSFGAITEVTKAGTASWNQVTDNTLGVPTLPAGTPIPAPTPTATTMTLQLQPASASSSSAVTIPLHSYHFGFEAAGTGKINFDNLNVTASYTSQSPTLLDALVRGKTYGSGVLTKQDNTGTLAVWALSTLQLTSRGIDSGGSELPEETLELSFGAITEKTSAATASWNQATQTTSGAPTPPTVRWWGALPTGTASTITLQLQPAARADSSPPSPLLTIPLDSYDFGFQSDATFATPGRVTFDKLQTTSGYFSQSPALLAALSSRQLYSSGVLMLRDSDGKTLAVWALGTILVISRSIDSGDGIGILPKETLELSFGAITEETSAGSASWNQLTHDTSGVPTPPAGTLKALPAPTAPTITLQLQPAAGTSSPPPLTIPLDSYDFGFQNSATFGTPGRVTFDELQTTSGYFSQSPALLAALTSGKSYSSGVLTQRDRDGKTVAVWLLGTICVTSRRIEADDEIGILPKETLELSFGAITEETSAGYASWNQVTHDTRGPRTLPASTLTALPAPTAPTITLQLRLTAGAQSSPPLTIPLDSYAFSFQNPLSTGITFGASGHVTFELQVTAPYASQSPALLAALTSGQSFSGVLTQWNTDGQKTRTWAWALGTISVPSDNIGGKAGILPEETLQLYAGSVKQVSTTAGSAGPVNPARPATPSFAESVDNLRDTGSDLRAAQAYSLKLLSPNDPAYESTAADVLPRGDGLDWFFANLSGGVKDKPIALPNTDILEELSF